MNKSVINLPTLISRISADAGVDLAVSRRFIHELFSLIESKLNEGEIVSINEIGEFACGLEPDKAIIFKVSDTIAKQVNEPFSAFKPVELNQGAEKEIVDKLEPIPTVEQEFERSDDENNIYKNPAPQQETSIGLNDNTATEIIELTDNIDVAEQPAFYNTPEIPKISEDDNNMTKDTPHISNDNTSGAKTVWLILGLFVGIIIGLIGGYFAGKAMGRIEAGFPEEFVIDEFEEDIFIEPLVNNIDSTQTEISGENSSEKVVSEPMQNEIPVVEPVYDTVTSTLAKLAGDHYGNKNYWVFIYKANPNLTNPNQIAPGTKVLIPPYESFKGATTAETNEKAREIMNEIAKKYKI